MHLLYEKLMHLNLHVTSGRQSLRRLIFFCSYSNIIFKGDGYDEGSYCDNILTFNGNIVDNVDMLPTIIIQVNGNFAKGYIIKEDLTLESCYIAKVDNFFAP